MNVGLFKKEQVYEENSYLLVDGKEEKKPFYVTYRNLLILVGILVLLIIIIVFAFNSSRNKKCKTLETLIMEAAEKYAKEEELAPTIEGDFVTISVDDLANKGYIELALLQNKDTTCTGTVKITRYKDQYIKTFDLKNCGSCTTESRYKWGKETSTYSNRHLMDVNTLYNYYGVESYHTSWTKYYPSSEISKEKSVYGNYLPLKDSDLPKIPETGLPRNIEQVEANYYSYRDKRWKYYKDNGGAYSGLSSEPVEGYPYKDTNTEMNTEWSSWSQEYPEVKSYRSIKSTKGYQWYYVNKNGKKVYYNNGEFLVEAPDSQYTEKSKETVMMYRYQDKMWRWYNGNKRAYSSYVSEAPKNYPNRDEELTNYTSWSPWRDVSYLSDANSWYREQEIDVYSKYRTEYDILSFKVLEEPITREELEQRLGKTLEEISQDRTIRLEATYQFRYAK